MRKINEGPITLNEVHMLLSITYVSTGPKPKTIADFWTLISQEEVTVIVCLTNLKEGAKVFILFRRDS